MARRDPGDASVIIEVMQERDARTTRPWTVNELRLMRSHSNLGAGAVADELDRSVASVVAAANRHRISLRRAGYRGGLVLGQPRGVSLKATREEDATAQAIAEVRVAIAAGDVDPGELERAVRRRRRLLLGEPLCPRCGENPQERPTGFCDECHWKHLAEAHRNGESVRPRATSEPARPAEYEREKKRRQRDRRQSQRRESA